MMRFRPSSPSDTSRRKSATAFAKWGTIAAVSSVLLFSGFAPSASAESLQYGDRSSDVYALHQQLIDLGYLQISAPTGWYGPMTEQAIARFQQDYALSVTGVADDITRVAVQRAVVKQAIVQDAAHYIGSPYLWGGTTPAGFDCSGFVYYLFSSHGVPMTRTSSSNLAAQGWFVDLQHLEPGDLVFFSTSTPGQVNHVGIYTGHDQFISATSSQGVQIRSMHDIYWGPRFLGARRAY